VTAPARRPPDRHRAALFAWGSLQRFRPKVRVGLPKQELLRRNAQRHRLRKARGQGVYLLAANKERLIDLLVRKGVLADDRIHGQAAIELALARWIDDETQ
jgi:hypothetical protein